ncbi:glycoside hydrolase family 16 protein [Rhodococcus jostii]|uniref:glycoside hydrolase family 16 protein n=1 Tax=Rhodococcus jostii TaxID=132919 RepID=UPI00362C1A5E
MELVFRDDFDGPSGTGVNRSDWFYDLGTSYPGGPEQWGTGEIETMTDSPDNVYLDGQGHLAIRPLRDSEGNWTSGRIETTRSNFAAQPGGKLYVEASLQQPAVDGEAAAGYWPAFWMLGDEVRTQGTRLKWPGAGEWDVMEGANGRDSHFGTLHCGVAPGGPCNEFNGLGSGEKPCSGCTRNFHTYAIEYDRTSSPEKLSWFRDGREYFTLSEKEVGSPAWKEATQHGFFLILNVAVGGAFPAAFGGGPTPATSPGAPMLVDHVAVYRTPAHLG